MDDENFIENSHDFVNSSFHIVLPLANQGCSLRDMLYTKPLQTSELKLFVCIIPLPDTPFYE